MKINVGNVVIGDSYVSIQTMIKQPLYETKLIIEKIEKLHLLGCDLVRIAVPDKDAVKYLKEITKNSVLPIIADIQFDYKLAIMAVDAGVKKIRINPGNIGDESKVREVIKCVKENNIPIRIGINAGSLPKHLVERYKNDKFKIMLEAAREELSYFEKYDFNKIVLSFKTSNTLDTIKINEMAHKEFIYPLHIGVTEAGDLIDGTIKNSIAISILLSKGIGDTIRVSLTSKEEDEVIVARKILESIGKRESKIEIISCPTCSRTDVDISGIVSKLKTKLENINVIKKIKIAVMGCVVNGPGEAKDSDFGVACGKGKSIIFKDGKKLKSVKNNEILDELLIILKEYEKK